MDLIVQIRLEYGLTIDQAKADAIDTVLDGCTSNEMLVLTPKPSETSIATATPTPTPALAAHASAIWGHKGNGRISCAEVQNHAIAPLRRGHPAYELMRDAGRGWGRSKPKPR